MIPHVNDGKEETDFEEIPGANDVKWYHRLLLNRSLKVFIAFLAIAITVPALLYNFIFFASSDTPPTDGYSTGSCLLPRETRLSCGVGYENATECHPQCCYDENNDNCFHRLPSRFSYIADRAWNESIDLYSRYPTVPFNNKYSIPVIRLSIDEVSATHMTINLYAAEEAVPYGRRIENKNYVYQVTAQELNIVVNRTEGNTIFNTFRGPLVAAENIWETAFILTEETMFGLGEIPLKEGTEKIIYNHNNGLSSIPLIFAKSNGSYHGLLIDIREPTEIKVHGRNQVVVRSITSRGLKFHLFLGPEPRDIMKDAMRQIGFSQEIRYWMLGAHVCSDASDTNSDAYEDLKEFLVEAENENFPFESHCGIRPVVVENEQCSEESSFIEEGAQLIRSLGKRFIPQISPYIYYQKINDSSEINVTDTTNDIHTKSDPTCPTILEEFEQYMLYDEKDVYKGVVADFGVIYPDYEIVTEEFMKRFWSPDIEIDGLILENTWPIDESIKMHNETYNYLPYFNQNFEDAFNHTLKWNLIRPSGDKHIYNHNEFGNNFAEAFRKIYKNDEFVEKIIHGDEIAKQNVIRDDARVATDATLVPIWASSQRLNGQVIVNRQSINTTWASLQRELTEAALGGISGHWLWSSPICGDTEHFDIETHTDLCVKWYMAASYIPMIKVTSKNPLRHPLSFDGTNKLYMLTALRNRMSLMPYFYTTLQEGPLLRPMFYQFPASDSLRDISTQFSVGEDLLIVPNLLPSQSHVHFWMPPGSWYELWSGLPLVGNEGEAVTMTTTNADLLTLVRGGSIVVSQKDVKSSAEETRKQSYFKLTIALRCINNTEENLSECQAKGTLYMTQNMSIIFESDGSNVIIQSEGNDFSVFCDTDLAIWAHIITDLNIYGLKEELNNYDYHRHDVTRIDLCDLQNQNIEFPLIHA